MEKQDPPLEKHDPPLPPAPIQDSAYGHWLDRLPASWRGFAELARLDRPIGTWLLFFPCLWGLALAGKHITDYPPLSMIALFGLGSIVMRGAGCTFNDLIDQDIDKDVARTAARPLPSGRVSRNAAWAFLAVQCLIGAVILLQFNTLTILMGLASLALVGFYPFAKRIIWFPQLVLGLTFNWGVWLGYSALANGLTEQVAWLYAAGVFWTLGYDTIYAHQDRDDDALIGMKSTALLLGRRTKPALCVFYGVSIFCLAMAGFVAGLHLLFWCGLAIGAWHMLYQIALLDIDKPETCLRQFRSNRDTGAIIAGAFLLGVF